MKKTIKALAIAASVAAVAGIGAVSFAAWSGETTNASRTSSMTTGNVTITAGFTESGTITLEGGALVPVDQGSGVTMLSGELGDVQVVKGTYSFTLTETSSTNLKLYYQVTSSDVSAPEIDADEDDEVISDLGDGWTAIGSATTSVSVTDNVEIVEGLKIYIVLVSSDTADMNQTVNLSLALNSAS